MIAVLLSTRKRQGGSIMLIWQIYAVDKNNRNHKALIGKCFNKGLAKIWCEAGLTADNYEIISEATGEKYFYNSKDKKWQ